MSLQVLGEIIQVFHFYSRVHHLFFKDDHILQEPTCWLGCLSSKSNLAKSISLLWLSFFLFVRHVGDVIRIVPVFQNLETKEIVTIKLIEDHFWQVHGGLKCLGI